MDKVKALKRHVKQSRGNKDTGGVFHVLGIVPFVDWFIAYKAASFPAHYWKGFVVARWIECRDQKGKEIGQPEGKVTMGIFLTLEDAEIAFTAFSVVHKKGGYANG